MRSSSCFTHLVDGPGRTLDPTFGTNGIVTTANTGANAAALQSDGKIVVAGSIPASQNQQQPGLLRYNTNGTLDPNFGSRRRGDDRVALTPALRLPWPFKRMGKFSRQLPLIFASRFSASILTAAQTIPSAATAL